MCWCGMYLFCTSKSGGYDIISLSTLIVHVVDNCMTSVLTSDFIVSPYYGQTILSDTPTIKHTFLIEVCHVLVLPSIIVDETSLYNYLV